MKKYINFIISIGFSLCLILFVGRKGTQKFDETQNIKDSGTKNYYKKIGYVPLTLSSDLKANGDIVYFEDGTTYVKLNSKISINVNNKYFANSNFPAADITNNKLLSGLKINGKVFLISEIDCNNLLITESTSIYPIFENFEVIGFAVTISEDRHPNNETIFNSDNLFYVITKDYSDIVNLTENNLKFNIRNNLKISNGNILNFNLTIELSTLDLDCKTHLLLKTNQNKFYLYEIKDNYFSCDEYKVSINFTEDLTTTENIKK